MAVSKKKKLTKTVSKKPAGKKAAEKKSADNKSASPRKKPEPPKKETRKVVAEIVDHNTPLRESHEEEFDLDAEETTPRALVTRESHAPATTVKDPLATYLAEVRRYPVLSREKELEIAKKYYETKDPALAQVLVTSNLRFVVKVAAEYSKFGARLIDLVQEGNMGLMHAVRDYNPYKGVRLITYAVWWIRGYIQEYLMKQYSLVKIGTTQNQKKLFYRLQKEKELLDTMGKGNDIPLLAQKMGIPEDEVQMMAQRMSGRDVSLNQPLDDENSTSLMDFQKGGESSPDDVLELKEHIGNLKHVLDELMPTLSAREKIILEERILNDEPLTLQEIGDKYNITREAVRQMEVRVMKKIKDKFTALDSPSDE